LDSGEHPIANIHCNSHNPEVTKTDSYGADPLLIAFWALICSPPAFVAAYLLAKDPTNENLVQFACAVAFPLLPIVFASRFRATFAPTEFVYRRWGPTVRVFYSDIERIEIANVTPLTKDAIGAFLVTKGGDRLPFWPKLFPRAAVNRFFALAR
jgi:hypothetical protein